MPRALTSMTAPTDPTEPIREMPAAFPDVDAPSLGELLDKIRKCDVCTEHLPLGPRPVVSVDAGARIMVIGQAPGTRVHASGIPWDDPSGDRLREWMGIDSDRFYNDPAIGIMPMGFCYPGRGRSGDLPPRAECAPLWHNELLSFLPGVALTLLIGNYAQRYYLDDAFRKLTLTERVQRWSEAGREFLPLPHPSPRNNLWLRKNPWFEAEVLPELRRRVSDVLGA